MNHEERRTNKCDKPLRRGNDSFVCSLKLSKMGLIHDWINSLDNLCPFVDEDPSSFSFPRISALCNADALDATASAGSEMSERNSRLTTCEIIIEDIVSAAGEHARTWQSLSEDFGEATLRLHVAVCFQSWTADRHHKIRQQTLESEP